MSEKPTIREQIDACRAGSADLSLPELAALASELERSPALAEELRRSQRLDGLIKEALADIPVPAGLAERILAASESSETAAEVSLPNRAERTLSRHWISRRQVLLIGGSIATILVIVVCARVFLFGKTPPIGHQELASDVGGWMNRLAQADWRSGKLPGGVTMDSAVLAPARQWQTVRGPNSAGWKGSATAIDLAAPGKPRAVLFVVRSSARFSVPTTPTQTALLSPTGGYKATAWQRPGSKLLYVLVIEEDRGQRLSDFLRKPAEA